MLIIVTVAVAILCSILSTPSHAFINFSPFNRNSEDLYGVLGLKRSATDKEIKKAFRTMAREEHPDFKPTQEEKDKAADKMRKILRAYDVLSDPEKRDQFDRFGTIPGETPQQQSPGNPFGNAAGFAHMFRQKQLMSRALPTVMAMTDASWWEMRDLRTLMSSQHQASALSAVQQFVQSFYVDLESDLAAGTTSIDALQSFLLAGVVDPKDKSFSPTTAPSVPPVRALVSSNMNADDAVATAVRLSDPKVSIKIVHNKQLMIDLATKVCKRSLGMAEADVKSIIILLNETRIDDAFKLADTSNQGRGHSRKGDAAPNWCKKLFVAPLRSPWRPTTVIHFVQSSFVPDEEVLARKYPNAIPIIRSQADFEVHCSPNHRKSSKGRGSYDHHDDTKGKYCAIYAVRHCDSDPVLSSAKGKGVLKSFMEPPMWADNRHRLSPFELVGVCLDRQPRLLGTLLTATAPTAKGPADAVTSRDLDKDDFIIMYDYSEPYKVGLYTHGDIARGGGLPKFGSVLASFLEEATAHHQNMRILNLPNRAQLKDTFLDEPSSFLDRDNAIIFGHTIRTHSLPPQSFPVKWYRRLAWKAAGLYYSNGLAPFFMLLIVYAIYKFADQKSPSPDLVRHVRLEEDLKSVGGFIILFIPRYRVSKVSMLKELNALVGRHPNLVSDSRFEMRQVYTDKDKATWRRFMDGEREVEEPDTAGDIKRDIYHVVAIRTKSKLVTVKPITKSLETWCSELADGTITPTSTLP